MLSRATILSRLNAARPILFPNLNSKSSYCQSFESLAKKYKNVGVCGKSSSAHEIEQHGSGVYLGNRFVLTAAHCVDRPAQYYFSAADGKPWHQVSKIYIHPDYRENVDRADLALLALATQPEGLVRQKINFKKLTIQDDCTTVGYPYEFSLRYENDVPINTLPLSWTKLAIKIPSCVLSYNGLIKHKVGHTYYKQGHAYVSERHDFNKLEVGVFNGMSGGGLFWKNALIGITVSTKAFDARSRVVGDIANFVPLMGQEKWLADTMRKHEENNFLQALRLLRR